MGLETGNRIEDLVTTNPVGATDDVNQGDDHLRLIKVCVQGSFPSLGATACDRTAADLNKAITSVFGREGPSDIVAQEGDYNIGQMGDVDTTGQSDGQGLIRRSGEWVPAKFEIKTGQYRTFNGIGNGDRVRVSTTVTDGSATGLATITPNAAAGFQVVADASVWLDIGISVRCTCPQDDGDIKIGIAKNGTDTFPSFVLTEDSANQPTQTREFSASAFATVGLVATDTVYIYFKDLFRTNTVEDVFVTTKVRER